MTSIPRMCAAVATAVLMGSPVTHANEEEIFESDSFLDPRDLGAELFVDKATNPGAAYKLFGVSGGRIGNYRDRSRFTGEQRDFVSAGYSRYWSDWQLSGSATAMQSDESGTTGRARISLGKYSLNHSNRQQDDDYVGRWLLSAVIDDREGADTEYEVIASMFLELPGKLLRARGGASVSFRAGDGREDVRFLWKSSQDFVHFANDHGRINGAFWVGYESVDGQSRFTPIRGQLLVEYRLAAQLELHVAYSPAYRFAGGGLDSQTNQEWMVSFYVPFGAELGE